MCLVALSTAHPEYALIVLSNRDEYLNRPTLRADWWKAPNGHVVGGRDLQRDVQGTWLGFTRQGRIAILTNFREEDQVIDNDARSRGEIPKSYLETPPTSAELPEQWARRFVTDDGVEGMGGFSLIFGQLKSSANSFDKWLGIISNRTPDVEGVKWIGGQDARTWGQTCSLSNSHFGDRAWPKVVDAERLLAELIEDSVERGKSEGDFINACFDILSRDTLPKQKEGQDWQLYIRELRHSIFIPPVGGSALPDRVHKDAIAGASEQLIVDKSPGIYGTQKQTILLVSRSGRAMFMERTLFDDRALPVPKDSADRRFEFDIDGWEI